MAAHSDIQSDGQTEASFISTYIFNIFCQKNSAEHFLLLVIYTTLNALRNFVIDLPF
jgi:hypothetical protein